MTPASKPILQILDNCKPEHPHRKGGGGGTSNVNKKGGKAKTFGVPKNRGV